MGQEPAANQPRHVVNQVIGLLAFAGGVVLLALVFFWAYRLYASMDANLFGVSPVHGQPQVMGVDSSAPLPPGSLSASPRPGATLSQTAVALVSRLLMLLVMGWTGGLIASKGIALAVGPPTSARPRE